MCDVWVDVFMHMSVGGWCLGGCIDECFSRCMVFGWMSVCMCGYVCGVLVDVWMDMSVGV